MGRVQGVGFRWFVVERAQALGLTGWVRNRADGAVEGEAQGAKTAELVEELRRGPRSARVERVETHPLALRQGESGFEIV